MNKPQRPRRKRLIRLLIEGVGTVIITGIRLWRVARSPRRRKAVPQLLRNGLRKLKPWFEPLAPAWRIFDKLIFRHVRYLWGLAVAFHRRTPVPRLRRLYFRAVAVFLVVLIFSVWWGTRPGPERDPELYKAKLMGETANLIAQKRLGKAEKNVAELKKMLPNDPTVLTFSGAVKSLRKDYNGAREDYRQALAAMPGSFNAMFNLAELEFVAGNYPAATVEFTNILQDHPREEVVLFRLYLCELLQGHDFQAKEYLHSLTPASSTPAWYYAEAAREFRDKNKSEGRRLVGTARTLYPERTAFFDSTFEVLNFR